MDDGSKLRTVRELVELLGISKWTINGWIRDGFYGVYLRVDVDESDRWVTSINWLEDFARESGKIIPELRKHREKIDASAEQKKR